jgi:transposase
VVDRSPKTPPEKALKVWAREWFEEGRKMDLGKPPECPSFEELPRRWVAERTLSWLNRFRRLKVRYERRNDIHQAFLDLGCALICWRFVQWLC